MTPQQVFKGTLIVLLTLLAGYILLLSGRILVVLLIAIIIASAARPLVARLTRLRVPQGAAIVFVYVGIASLIVLVSVAIMPPIINQIARYIENDWQLSARIIRAQEWVEQTISDVTQSEVSLVAPDEVRETVSSFVVQVRRIIPGMLNDLGGTLGDAILIFVMGAYWLTSHQKATSFITHLSPPQNREKAASILDEIEQMMGGYVRGIVSIVVSTFLLNLIGMQVLGVPNALALSFIIALTTAIPIIGGLIGGLIALFMTLIAAPQYVPAMFIVFIVVQQIENYFLMPRIMSNHVGLDPLLVIVYTAVGFLMAGIVGALIAVPIMGTIHILLERLIIEPYKENLQVFQSENGLLVAKAPADREPDEAAVLQEG